VGARTIGLVSTLPGFFLLHVRSFIRIEELQTQVPKRASGNPGDGPGILDSPRIREVLLKGGGDGYASEEGACLVRTRVVFSISIIACGRCGRTRCSGCWQR
jgi:hypothetical protein